MRKCKTCKVPKSLTDFYRDRASKFGRTYMCKECAKEYQKQYNRKNRALVTEKSRIKRQKIKMILVQEHGGKCCLCGYHRYLGALAFHHKDPSKKDFHVSDTGINKARQEASKCALLCKNCHDEVHAGISTLPD